MTVTAPGSAPVVADAPKSRPRQRALGALTALLAIAALIAPLSEGDVAPRVGLLLAVAACVEIVHGFRRATDTARRAAWFGGALSLAMGLILINAPLLASLALLIVIAGSFAVDGLRYAVAFARSFRGGQRPWRALLPAVGNLAATAVVLLLRGRAVAWTVAVAGAFRIAGTAWNLVTSEVFTGEDAGDTVIDDLQLTGHPALYAIADDLEREERMRAPIDRAWVWAFLATLLAIHAGRMGTDGTLLGLVSPAVAVAGDVVFALLIAFGLVQPAHLLVRRVSRRLERRAWTWCLDPPDAAASRGRRLVRALVTHRLRLSIRLRAARYSVSAAFSRGLQLGLPFAAIIAATVPVWGMSWYFDTENWAAGIWNSWAESRTDAWREAMIHAVARAETDAGRPSPAFALTPPGIAGAEPFSFIVIGDTGEGDASQHVLRDQLITAASREDVRFVVISSDVVYPTGAMRDYELKFWLPFKGVTKPVYAIPGNHDWYDALEAFVATFLEPSAARLAMRARVEADARLTGTTDAHIESLVARAARFRREYGVPTGFQQAPFFQVQTDRFALIAVDTGVARRVDPTELEWLNAALRAADGKLTMVVLGHPLYAGGEYLGTANEDFARIHQLLREHHVALVMAGDTHDLEYYVEPGDGHARTTHVVNGGGGAYLSFGTALAWPAPAATPDWAFYPSRAAVTGKIEEQTPRWKSPAWWWTRRFGAWPFSAEWLSAAFDYNSIPFFQSFVEVHVEPREGRLRLRPIGVRGRLRWADLEHSPSLGPAGDELVEWVVTR